MDIPSSPQRSGGFLRVDRPQRTTSPSPHLPLVTYNGPHTANGFAPFGARLAADIRHTQQPAAASRAPSRENPAVDDADTPL